ncbi:MAG: rod shape-determining protein MreC [Bacteroidetes bacterium]|nr:rod shape-determining protein MreC [Bacteroidota bacterium]
MINYFRRFFFSFKEYIILICLLIISLAILSANDSAEVKNLRKISFATFAVFNSAVDWVGDFFIDDQELLKQRKINAELMLQVNKLREYGLENFALKEMLGFKKEALHNLIPAKVISKFVSDIQGTYVINLGTEDSINVGMPVVTEKGLAGIVIESSENFSLIRTLKNIALKIAVVNQRSNVDGVLKFNGEKLIIENIPTTYNIGIGDRMMTSDFSTIFPPSIPVGVISGTVTDISGVLTTLEVEPYVDLEALRNVFVIQFKQSKQIDSLELNLLRR